MYMHAESVANKPKLPSESSNDNLDESIVAFIRLGSDVMRTITRLKFH